MHLSTGRLWTKNKSSRSNLVATEMQSCRRHSQSHSGLPYSVPVTSRDRTIHYYLYIWAVVVVIARSAISGPLISAGLELACVPRQLQK